MAVLKEVREPINTKGHTVAYRLNVYSLFACTYMFAYIIIHAYLGIRQDCCWWYQTCRTSTVADALISDRTVADAVV